MQPVESRYSRDFLDKRSVSYQRLPLRMLIATFTLEAYGLLPTLQAVTLPAVASCRLLMDRPQLFYLIRGYGRIGLRSGKVPRRVSN